MCVTCRGAVNWMGQLLASNYSELLRRVALWWIAFNSPPPLLTVAKMVSLYIFLWNVYSSLSKATFSIGSLSTWAWAVVTVKLVKQWQLLLRASDLHWLSKQKTTDLPSRATLEAVRVNSPLLYETESLEVPVYTRGFNTLKCSRELRSSR